MALELFKPFIFSKLQLRGLATTIKAAKKMVEREGARGLGHPRGGDPRAPGDAEPRADPAPSGHPGLRAGADRGQGHPAASAGLHRLQRGLRRRPDGRARAALPGGSARGAGPHDGLQQHPLAGQRRAHHRPLSGRGARSLLHDPRAGGRPRRGPRVLRDRRGAARLRVGERGSARPGQGAHPRSADR